MIYYSYDLDKLVRALKFVPYKLKRNAKYVVGKTYWCSYWQKYYTVLKITGTKAKIKWCDGKIVEHRTSLDTICDYELKPFQYKASCERSFTAAEIRALCCAGIIHSDIAMDLERGYFKSNKRPNDYNYYYIKHNTKDQSVYLVRDTLRSPRR